MLATETMDNIAKDYLSAICRKIGGLKYRQTRSRAHIYEALGCLSQDIQEAVLLAVEQAIADGNTKYSKKRKAERNDIEENKYKRKKNTINPSTEEENKQDDQEAGDIGLTDLDVGETTGVDEEQRSTTAGMESTKDVHICPSHSQHPETMISNDFMRSPTQAELDSAVARFIEATSNEALEKGSCGSCARETPSRELKSASIESIQTQKLLAPSTSHPAHELTNGMLLYKNSVNMTRKLFKICVECETSLHSDKTPKLSLANNMWIGDVPRELKGLTLPERILIAKYYPAAYIIKLLPKKKGANKWDTMQMHNGLRGNVSTYKLDPKQVISMVDGINYPPTAKILSATIGVTFIGPKGLPEKTMPEMFRVRRRRVREALQWLKNNNPLYANIEISEENLLGLPEDGVPPEISLVAKYSSDIMSAEKEGAGYVPEDAEEEGEGERKSANIRRKKLTQVNQF